MSWSREWSSVARVGEHPRKHTTAFGTDEAKLAPTFHEGGDGAKHPFVRFADGARLRLPPGSEGVLASGSGSGITVVAVVRARANKDGGHEPALLSCVIFDLLFFFFFFLQCTFTFAPRVWNTRDGLPPPPVYMYCIATSIQAKACDQSCGFEPTPKTKHEWWQLTQLT
jgi:hypothetical protein